MFKKKYKITIGLSDHTLGNSLAISSLALGAKVFEKHFKLNKQGKSVDSFFSQDEDEFKNYIFDIRQVEKSLNNKAKINPEGYKNMRSIYIAAKIMKNDKITKFNIKVSRPGLSLHPKYYNKIIGLKVNKNLNLGDRLLPKFIKNFNSN